MKLSFGMSAVILVAVSSDGGQMRRDEPQKGHQPTANCAERGARICPPAVEAAG